MSLPLLDSIRASTIAMAVGAVLAGCGGGNASSDDALSAGTTTVSAGTTATGTTSTDASTTTAETTTTATDATAGNTTDTAAAAATTTLASTVSATNGVVTVGSGDTVTTSGGSTAIVVASAATKTSSGASDTGAAATKKSGVGINLASIDYYSSILPTIDLMKRSGPWLTQCNPYVGTQCKNFTGKAGTWDTLEESSLNLDAAGWPQSLPSASDTTVKYRSVTAILFANGWQQAGKYVVRYDGSGTLSYSGVGTKNVSQSSAGRDVVDVVVNGANGMYLTINATDPTNHLRNVRVYPPGGACSGDLTTYAASAAACTGATGSYVAFENFPSDSIWHPAFLNETKGFRTLRFMDWGRTNGNMITDWSARSSYTGRTWNSPVGVPLEAMINLANTVSADPWLNIPTHATDDYVRQFARVLHANMASGLTANIEYSNEPWNYSFAASSWIYQQAQATWPAEVANKTDPYVLASNWYANRLVQVCNLIKTEFGADSSRVRCVANSQAGVPFVTNSILNCSVAAKTTGQACAKSIDVVAIAPYFGGYIPAAKYRSVVSSWYSSADGGVTQMFNELLGSESTNTLVAKAATPLQAISAVTGGSLTQVHGWMTAQKAALDKFNIPMWAYEGGQSMVAPAGNTDTTLQKLINTTNHDARMGAVYAQMLADWKAAGGQTFAFYSDVSMDGQYGDWGLMLNQFDTTQPKWQAVAQARDSSCWWTGC